MRTERGSVSIDCERVQPPPRLRSPPCPAGTGPVLRREAPPRSPPPPTAAAAPEARSRLSHSREEQVPPPPPAGAYRSTLAVSQPESHAAQRTPPASGHCAHTDQRSGPRSHVLVASDQDPPATSRHAIRPTPDGYRGSASPPMSRWTSTASRPSTTRVCN